MTAVCNIDGAWLAAPATQAVFSALEVGGYRARAVGGVVRNALLGLPVTDIDVATDAPPDETMRLARAAGLKAIPNGLAHGTVTLIVGGLPFEVTTLRRDVETDGRHAKVVFTDDWHADASRRDFTINALYCERDGRVFDPLGGLADLAPLRVRFIGDPHRRIEEDYLRVLRFFRFSAIYCADGALDPAGLAACRALSAGLSRISGERIKVELDKLLAASHAIAVTRAMIDAGVFAALFHIEPRMEPLESLVGIEAQLNRPADPVLRLCALAVRVRRDGELLHKRLKLSAQDRDRLVHLPERLQAIEVQMGGHISQTAIKALAYRIGVQNVLDCLLIAAARQGPSTSGQAWIDLAMDLEHWTPPIFPVSGADALALGVASGPRIGTLLAAVEHDWIASGFAGGREQLLVAIRDRIAE